MVARFGLFGELSVLKRASMQKRTRVTRSANRAGSINGHRGEWTPNAGFHLKGAQNTQKNYERYLALAQGEAQNGNLIAAENYYQHAEHFLRSLRDASVAAIPTAGTAESHTSNRGITDSPPGADWR